MSSLRTTYCEIATRTAVAADVAWVVDLKKPDLSSAADFVTAGKFHCAEAQLASKDFNGAWGFTDYALYWLPPAVLAAMMVVTFVFILVLLKRRDSV